MCHCEIDSHSIENKLLLDMLMIYGITGWEQLLEIAEYANPPEHIKEEEDWWSEKVFESRDCWKVVIFYDGDTIDFIDLFILPDGTKLDFWKWPEDNQWRDYLINWRGVGDLERLKRINND